MKSPSRADVVGILSSVGALVSTIAVAASLGAKLEGLGSFLPAAATLVAVFLVGYFSKDVVKLARALPSARRVFISYPFSQRPTATEVAERLRRAGARVWLDVEQVRPGEPIRTAIERGLRDSDLLVYLLAREQGATAAQELELAQKLGVKTVIVKLQPDARLPDGPNVEYLDLSQDRDAALSRLSMLAH